MLTRTACRRRTERGSALIGAIALLVLASFVIVAMMVSSSASRDTARGQLDVASAEQLARQAGTIMAASYSSVSAGEHSGFILTERVLREHASRLPGAAVRSNGAVWRVDDDRVPREGRFYVRQPIGEGRFGNWQIYSVRLPSWGVTKGGQTEVFVRAWTDAGSNATASQPMIFRLEFRPTWFADYQMLFDGPLYASPNATFTGRVHSNGHRESFFDQSASQSNQIELDGSTCTGAARLTTARGTIGGTGNCIGPSFATANNDRRINLLRAKDLADRLLRVCGLPAGEKRGVSIACVPNPTGITRVVLGADGWVRYGAQRINANVVGNRPVDNQGAVLVVGGDVDISGVLPARARALIVAASPVNSTNYGSGGAPSAWIRSRGNVGSHAGEDRRSSFGVVAEGDIIFDERTACPVTARGAFTSITGLMSIHPTWRVPLQIGGGTPCSGTAAIRGSIVGHFPPAMRQPLNTAGYDNRSYSMLNSLYDNPPPIYPTAADWQVTKFAPANLDCFERVGGAYTLRATSCG